MSSLSKIFTLNLTQMNRYKPQAIIDTPQAYTSEAGFVAYLLLMASDDFDVCEFLLLDPRAERFTNNFDSIANITLLALASTVMNQVESRNQGQRILNLVCKFNSLLDTIQVDELADFDHLQRYFNQIKSNLASGSIHFWKDSTLNTDKIKSQSLIHIMTNKAFLSWMVNNDLAFVFANNALPMDNQSALTKVLQTLLEMSPQEIYMNATTIELMNRIIVNGFMGEHHCFPAMDLCRERIFWRWLSLTTESAGKKIKSFFSHDNQALNTFINELIEAIKSQEGVAFAQRFFKIPLCMDWLSLVSQQSLKAFLRASVDLASPVIDAAICECMGLRKAIKRFNDGSHEQMIARLTDWFDYNYFLKDPTNAGQFTACVGLVHNAQNKIIAIKEKHVFISLGNKETLISLERAKVLGQTKVNFLAIHKQMADFIVSRFQVADNLSDIKATHEKYHAYLFQRIAQLDTDCYEASLYALDNMPPKMRDAFSADDEVVVEGFLSQMAVYSRQLNEQLAYYSTMIQDTNSPSYPTLRSILSSYLDYKLIGNRYASPEVKEAALNKLATTLFYCFKKSLEAPDAPNQFSNLAEMSIDDFTKTSLTAEYGESFLALLGKCKGINFKRKSLDIIDKEGLLASISNFMTAQHYSPALTM